MNLKFWVHGGALVLAAALASDAMALQSDRKDNRECAVPTYNGNDLDQPPRITAKPEPNFSRKEHEKYYGQVITLRAILCGSGSVTDLELSVGYQIQQTKKPLKPLGKLNLILQKKTVKTCHASLPLCIGLEFNFFHEFPKQSFYRS